MKGWHEEDTEAEPFFCFFLFFLADTSIAATSAKRAKKRSLVLLKKKI